MQGEASTMFGRDEINLLTAGAAIKTGYNWELFNGKFIVQPNVLAAYTFVNTFDYTTKAGVRIKSDPLNAITAAPGVKFIGNLKNGWQPYLSVSVVMNFLDETKFSANEVTLPEMSIKPYVLYGVGVQNVGARDLRALSRRCSALAAETALVSTSDCAGVFRAD